MNNDVVNLPNGSRISEPVKALQTTAIPICKSQPDIGPKSVSDETFHRRVLGTDADWILYLATAIFISEVILAWPR